ncbi:MAG: glycosyltransferase [Chloroflexi bacterium]|nr:glycosyltransferase [Chloroflexota bacterium]
MERLSVAYILSRFPILTETFIADEIAEARKQGVDIRLFSLLRPKPGIMHQLSQQLAKDVEYAPGLFSWQLWASQAHFLAHSPSAYLDMLRSLIRQPYARSVSQSALKRLTVFLKAAWVARKLEGSRVQLAHAHFASLPGAAAAVVSRLLGIPFTVTVHAYDIYASNDLLDLVARSASRVIAISNYNRQQVLALCPGADADKIAVVHCGIRRDLFTPSAPNAHAGRPLQILSVGSLIGKKGHAYLIQACQILKQRGEDFRCTIVGQGPGKDHLTQLAADCGVQDRVVLAGGRERHEVLEAYRESDVFVLPCIVAPGGDRDGIPVVLMEAMAVGLPVISTPVSGIPELVRHDDSGWLVPEQNAEALADAISHLAGDAELRKRLVSNGSLLVEREFDIRENVGRLAGIFVDVANHRV